MFFSKKAAAVYYKNRHSPAFRARLSVVKTIKLAVDPKDEKKGYTVVQTAIKK